MKEWRGEFVGKGRRFGLVVSRFNEFVSKGLRDGAIDCLTRHQVDERDIEVFWTSGSFEIPLVAKQLAKSNRYDAVICLGVVIRGDTPHFDLIAGEVAKGIAQINLELGVPTMFGIVTADTLEQAIDRAGAKDGNKGWAAAQSAIEMVNLLDKIKKK